MASCTTSRIYVRRSAPSVLRTRARLRGTRHRRCPSSCAEETDQWASREREAPDVHLDGPFLLEHLPCARSLVVEDNVRSERAYELTLLFRTCRRDDLEAFRLGELDYDSARGSANALRVEVFLNRRTLRQHLVAPKKQTVTRRIERCSTEFGRTRCGSDEHNVALKMIDQKPR